MQKSSNEPDINSGSGLRNSITFSGTEHELTLVQLSLLVSTSTTTSLLALIWSSMYYYIGLYKVAIIPFSFAILSFISLAIYKKTGRNRFYKNSQLTLLSLLPFLVTVQMGGFIVSSAVILWALLAPIGTMMYGNYKRAPHWFGLLLLLLLVSLLLENTYTSVAEVPIGFQSFFFFFNIASVSAIVIYAVYYFVNQKTKAFDLLNRLAEEQFSVLIDNINTEDDTFTNKDVKSVFFMIISDGGLAKYSNLFGDNKMNDLLISGFLSAVNNFSSETFGTEMLKEMSYKDFRLKIEQVNGFKMVYAYRGEHHPATMKFEILLENLKGEEFEHIYRSPSITINDDFAINKLVETVLG